VQVGDLVKERRGLGRGMIIKVYHDLNMEFGAHPGEYTQVEVLYSDGKLFRHSSRAYDVISSAV